jgi:hypothetical protein
MEMYGKGLSEIKAPVGMRSIYYLREGSFMGVTYNKDESKTRIFRTQRLTED